MRPASRRVSFPETMTARFVSSDASVASRPKLPPLVVRGAGREHAERDVVLARAVEEPGGDLAERAVAPHGDDDAIAGAGERFGDRGNGLSAGERWEEVAGDAGRGEPGSRAGDALGVASALRRGVRYEEVGRLSHRPKDIPRALRALPSAPRCARHEP